MSARTLPATSIWWLPWACGMTFALLGWLSPAQVAITLGLEIALAAHHARQRTLLSEGAIAKDGGTLSSENRALTITAGQRLTQDERQFYARGMTTLITTFALCAAFMVTIFSGFTGVTWWASVGWLGWSAASLWADRQQFLAWRDSDAPSTADPSAHVRPILTRTTTFFVAIFPVVFLMPQQDTGDPSRLTLTFGSCILLTLDMAATGGARRLWDWLHTPSVPSGSPLDAPAPTGPPITYRRLPAPEPTWVPEQHWTPGPGWYGLVPGWEQRSDGTWRRTADHPYGEDAS